MKKEKNKSSFERGLAVFIAISLSLIVVGLILTAGGMAIYEHFNTS